MRRGISAYSQYQQFAVAVLCVSVCSQIRRVSFHCGAAEWAFFPAVAHHESLVVLVVNASATGTLATILRHSLMPA